MTGNRITGNAAAAATGLDQDSNNVAAVANATENWWGCNGGPGAAGCDTVANQNATAGSSFTTSPFVTLRTTASPTTILAGGASTLTTSFLKDSAGSALSTSQISELIGLPVSWTNAMHGAFSNQQTTIQPGGTATATLTNDNSCTNTSGQSKVDNVQTSDSLATATLTTQCPDFTVAKTNDVSGTSSLGDHWTWKLHVSNGGAVSGTFPSGATVVSDDLPSSGLTYGAASVSNATGVSGAGTLTCAIASNTLTCTATGGPVVVASPGSFDVTFTATPSTAGTFDNPRALGTCAVDPGGAVAESSEANNTCSNSVLVTAADLTVAKSDDVSGATTLGSGWNWKLHVANGGNGDATFASGQMVLSDDLPNTNVAYATPSISGKTAISGTGTLNCSIAADTLTCVASAGTVIVGSGTGAFDVSVAATPSRTATFTNPRSGGSCSVDPGNAITESSESNNACNSDTVAVTAPDLTATKTDDVSGTTAVGSSFNWTIHVANGGDAPATFASAATVLSDDLPNSGIGYGAVSISGTSGISGTGTLACSITADTLSCTASGGTVVLGASTGAFDVTFSATATVAQTFANPRSGGTCAADPGAVITESDETNNSCSDSVLVTGADLSATKTDDTGGATTLGHSWTWKIHLANPGSSAATFNSGDTVMTDDLPNVNIAYGAATVANASGVTGTGTLSCSIAAATLTCTASGGTVIVAASTGAVDVSVDATPTAVGTFANPRSGGACEVNPGGAVPESNTANDTCSDTVTVTEPDLTATKTDDVSGVTTLGRSWTWKIHVANLGSGEARFASGDAIVRDDLPTADIAYGVATVANASGVTGTGSLGCSIAASTLTCSASGGTVVIGPSTGAFDISFTATPSAPGSFANPRSGGVCSVDPDGALVEASTTNNSCSDTVTVSAPDLTASKTNDVGGATTLGHSWTWKIHVANTGTADATFASDQTVVSDDLPSANIAYGSAAVANAGGLTGTGTLSCSVLASTLNCTASGGSVAIAPAAGFDVSVTATPNAGGSFVNPRTGGICAVDPGIVTNEFDTANNSCHDTVIVGSAPTVALTTPPDGADYNLGQHVSAAYSCQEGPGGPGLQSCAGSVATGAALDTSTVGTHSFTVTATSVDGLSTAVTHSYTVAGPPKAIISSPASSLTFRRGQRVSTRFSCAEAAGGAGLRSCSDSHAAQAPSGQLDTSHKGTFTYTVTALSNDGQRGTASITYRINGDDPDNHFTVSGIHLHHDGSAQFKTTTPGAGQLDVLETAWHNNEVEHTMALLQPAVHRFVFARAHSRSPHKGDVEISVRPNRRGAELVKHHHYAVQIRLWITFTPTGGTPHSKGYYGLFVTR